MNIFAILSLTQSVVALFLGAFVLSKDSKKQVNILFALLCVSLGIVGFSEFGMRSASNYETAYFWLRISDVFPIALSFLMHFVFIFTEKNKKNKNKAIYLIIYLPGIILSYLAITTGYMGKEPILKFWGWTYGERENPLFMIYVIWGLAIVFISLYLCFERFKKSSDQRIRSQSLFIFIGILINLILFIIFDITISAILGIEFPEFGVAGYVLCCIFIGYAIWKYQLFTLNFTTASETIILNISDPLILINQNGDIIALNNSTLNLFQYEKNELINKPLQIILSSKDDVEKFHTLLNSLLSTNLIEIEIYFKTKFKKNILIALSASNIKNKYGQKQGIVLIGRDITEHKIMEEALKEAIKRQELYIDHILKSSNFKSDFLSNMSHELRTPLNSIIGFCDLLLEEVYGTLNENQREYLKDIDSSSEYLLNLINTLLDISKIESGELILNFDKIELNEIINQIQNSIKPLYQSKNLFFKIKFKVNEKIIYADLIRLKQILLNLLSNAIKFTEKGGIYLKVSENKDFWIFSLKDTGIGIAEKDFDLIFKEFKRVNSEYVSSTPGTGLGLALTKRLVNLHNGTIWFKSKLGEGSTFIFTISKNN